MLPLRDAVVFPMTTRRILVGREMSLHALDYAENHDNVIVLVAQRDVTAEELAEDGAVQIYSFGPGLVRDGEIAVSYGEEVARAIFSPFLRQRSRI